MNFQQVIFFAFSSFVLSQYNQQQQQQQYYNNQQAQYYNQQPYSSAQSIVNSYYENYYPSGQYRQSVYAANAPVNNNNNLSSYRQERMAERQNAIQSISSYAAANGYNDPASIPEDVRKSIIASYVAANSGKISQRIQSASAFMATQTQINPTSLAQAISSVAATATGKKKGIFERFKAKKAKATATGSISPTATTGLNQGFKNFFKSIQMKIQKTSATSSIAPTTSA